MFGPKVFKDVLPFPVKENTLTEKEVEMQSLVAKFASELSKLYKVPDNDVGPFDTTFCWKLETRIGEAIAAYNLEVEGKDDKAN